MPERHAAKLQKSVDIDPVQVPQGEKLKASVNTGGTLTATAGDWLARGTPNSSDTHHARKLRNINQDMIRYLAGAVSTFERSTDFDD